MYVYRPCMLPESVVLMRYGKEHTEGERWSTDSMKEMKARKTIEIDAEYHNSIASRSFPSSSSSSTAWRLSNLHRTHKLSETSTDFEKVKTLYLAVSSSSSSNSRFRLDVDRSICGTGCCATATLALYIGSYSYTKGTISVNRQISE